MGINSFFSLGIEPLNFSFDKIRSCFGLMAGFGVVQTIDDLSALQAENDPRAQSTQVQYHPLSVWSMYSSINFEKWGLIVHFDQYAYLEGINATTSEMKKNQVLSIRFFKPFGKVRVGQYVPESLIEQYKSGDNNE